METSESLADLDNRPLSQSGRYGIAPSEDHPLPPRQRYVAVLVAFAGD